MPAFGVYPVADALLDGEEISSTYEGRHLTLLESELTHEPGLAFVTKGHPVVSVVGNIVGIPFRTCRAASDLVAIDTEGIWIVDVHAIDDGGNIAVAGGDPLYINTTTCVVSKIRTAASQIPFGYSLGIITTPGNVERIAVKLHWDPTSNWVRDLEEFYFGDGRDCNLQWAPGIIGNTEVLLLANPAVGAGGSALQILAAATATLQDVGIAAYFDATFGGQSVSNWMYAAGIWLNLLDTYIASAGGWASHEQLSPLSLGIYSPANANSADADLIYGVKAECIFGTATHGCYFAALNVSQPAANRTAIFYSMNTQSVGHVAVQKSGVSGGALALAVVNGDGYGDVLYVNLWRT